MIRVDSLEQLKKLRESGFNDDVMVLFKGGDGDGEEAGKAAGEEAGEEDGKEAEETGKASVQFDYDKVISELEKRLTPVIQKKNRTEGNVFNNEDDDIDAIMKKFTEM